MGIRVKNITGTSKNTCSCDSWLDHWKNFSDNIANWCSAKNCLNDAEVGGHVIKKGITGDEWYIIPLCKACNNVTTDYKVSWLTTFVPANVSDTCR